ncbi:MAG: Ig-like domain-containing protein, partial [Novosphingobium sp.]|nr:Ig-like domain-containing protein [Novosphingobium sp.]
MPEAGGSTSSFTNTPQAGTDSYSYIEDYLLAHSELYNQAYDILTLDVMANDLGGKAKSLFSIDDGYGNQISDLSQTDLLTNSNFSTWQPTARGHQIRIIKGKIEYQLLDGQGDVRDVDSLNSGEIISDSFTYAIKLGNGTLSWARVSVNLTGTNDAPVAVADTAAGHENETLTIAVLANDTDVDDGAVLTVTSTAAPSGKGTASVVANQVVFDPGTDFDHLAVGVTEHVVVSYSIEDQHGAASSSTVTITITGTNDEVTIVAADTTASGTVVEDSADTASLDDSH